MKLSNSRNEAVLNMNSVKVEKRLLPFNKDVQYAFKNIINDFILTEIFILQDSEGHSIIFVADFEMVNQQ